MPRRLSTRTLAHLVKSTVKAAHWRTGLVERRPPDG